MSLFDLLVILIVRPVDDEDREVINVNDNKGEFG